MKVIRILTLVFMLTTVFSIQSRAQLSQELKERVLTEVENRLPKIINEGQDKFKVIEVDHLDIGNKRTKIKGSFDLELLNSDIFENDIQFKSKLNYNNGELNIKYFKIHVPGDRFLFFKKFRRLL